MAKRGLVDSYVKDIAASATPENLIADSGDQWKFAREIVLRAPSGNSSPLLIGTATRRAWTLAAGAELRLSTVINRMSQSTKYSLADIWVQAQANGDDVEILLLDPELD